MRSAYRPFVWCMSVLLEIIWTTLRKEHLLTLHSAFPPRRGLRAPALLGLEILHGFQQPLIVLLARHQGGAKPGRRCNNTTWSLVGLSGDLLWVQPAVLASLTLLVAFRSHERNLVTGISRFGEDMARHSGLYASFTTAYFVAKCHAVTFSQKSHLCNSHLSTLSLITQDSLP